MELWVRILSLPTEYMSFEPIQAILDYNKIGELMKLDPYTELKSKAKYARVCVKVTNARKFKGDVILPNFRDASVKRVFNLWYEGVSEGCVNYWEAGHVFPECPLKSTMDRNTKIVIEKYKAKEMEAEGSQEKETNQLKRKNGRLWWIAKAKSQWAKNRKRNPKLGWFTRLERASRCGITS